MDRKEINPDVENPAVIDRKVVEHGKSVARTGTSAQTKDDEINWITEIKKICDVHQGPYLRVWNSIFVISCVFAVSLDPLFFYVVNVDQDSKCLHTDGKLKIVVLVMRSLTDVILLVHLICEISDSVQKIMDKKSGTSEKIAQNVSWLSIITDVSALLPLPQLIILMFYPTKNSGFVDNKMFVNVFLLGQYVPRVFRIHLSAKVFKRMNGIWANGLFNLFLYILAGHVLGAFWYFFSIQREASCWYEACVKLNACVDPICIKCKDTFYCDTTARKIIIYLNESCPLDIPKDTKSSFDFGIFLDSLQNKNPEQKFGKKFLYSFCNFGTNLETSTYVWENLFAIFISVTGLLLFLYLIGNVQAFMQMGATKTEDMRRQGIKTEEAIKTLTKIPMLKDMDEKVLTMMCDYLKPATYIENSFVFRTGDPLDCMLFIIEGTMWTYASSDSHAGQGISSMAMKPLRKGDFYGEELLNWASDCFTEVPVSSKHVKSRTKVEAYVLMAEDLETVVSQFRPHGDLLNRNNAEEVEKVTLSAVLRFHTKAQRRPPPSLAETGDDSSETLIAICSK